MTMSTNLGWPSEPEPGPEHRRLGWLARMLDVSRETSGASTVDSDSGQLAGDSSSTIPPGATGEGAGASATRDNPTPSPATGQPPAPELNRNGSTVVGGGAQREGGADGSAAATTEPTDGGSEHRSEDAVEQDARGAADDRTENHADDEVLDRATAAPDASRNGAEVLAEATAAGDLPPEQRATPVDNAVDEASGNAAGERETRASGAGDNAVDDAGSHAARPGGPGPDAAATDAVLRADREDRDALAAAIPTVGDDTPLARELAENARRRIQLTGRPFPKPASPRVLTVANQKGGVGKTTTTVNIAAAMAQSGLKVLVVDLDPQGNASTAMGIDHHAEVPSIYDVLVDSTPLLEVIQPCTTVENLFCAPATIDLAGAEIELVSLVARESRLQKAILSAGQQGHEFDYILIDCPPSLGLLTVNAMVAASEVFIPIQCEYYALEGLSQLLKNIDLVRVHLNPALHVSTILLTMYDGRTRLSAQVADEVREHFPEQVLRTTVPRSVRVSEAPSFGETVMTYDPASSGALAYLEAAGEIADRGAAGRT